MSTTTMTTDDLSRRFSVEELSMPLPLITDEASLAGYLVLGYTLHEGVPYYWLQDCDKQWVALVDRALAQRVLVAQQLRPDAV
jgi:hypothetical protein